MGYINRINAAGDAEGNFTLVARKLGSNGRWGLHPVGVFQLNEDTQTLVLPVSISILISMSAVSVNYCYFKRYTQTLVLPVSISNYNQQVRCFFYKLLLFQAMDMML